MKQVLLALFSVPLATATRLRLGPIIGADVRLHLYICRVRALEGDTLLCLQK